MASTEKLLAASSGGKDSVLALHQVRTVLNLEVASLFTTLNTAYDRVNMHGVRKALIEEQAAALGLPLYPMGIFAVAPGQATEAGTSDEDGFSSYLSDPQSDAGFTAFPSNQDYEKELKSCLRSFHEQGVRRVVFGDIFLEDLKAYRDRLLGEQGFTGLYPLWKRDSREVLEEFLGLGFQAIAVCVDSRRLDASFAGRILDRSFLADLPAGVDPCGENGEFHTFVFDGPGFRQPVGFERGRVAEQAGYWFCDLVPKRPACGS